MVGRGKLVAGLVASVVLAAALWITIWVRGMEPQLGLDLQGGVSITLIPAPGQGEIDSDVLDQTVTVIRQRVDGLGVAEPDIARQGDTVQVQLPGVVDRDQALAVIGRTAQLQFRRVLEVIPPEAPAYAEAGEACGQAQDSVPPVDQEVVLCQPVTASDVGDAEAGDEQLPPEQWIKYRLGPVELSGTSVTDASAELQPGGFGWDTALTLDAQGGQTFQEVTAELACEPQDTPLNRFAIVLDGIVESAPGMDPSIPCGEGIPGGRAVISTGGEDEARELAVVLRTGALPIELDFATAQSVSPTLGRDSLVAGLQAGFLGLALVALYLVVLYRGMGVLTVVELAMFGVVTYGVVVAMGELIGFTLTLAGIAGVIVSIGIAADSSIIYRERYRDEIRAGRTIRSASDHAYRNAWRTNLTGNTVSFLAAVVLYVLAVGPVRGFAFTLGLSTVIDTVLFATFTRCLFGLIARTPALARSRVMGLRADTFAPRTPRQADAR